MKIGDCFPDDYVVVDVETSGLNPSLNRVLEIGVLMVRNRGIQQPAISWVLNPNFPDDGFEVPAKITELTGITSEEVAKTGWDPAFPLSRLQDICDEKMILSHNGIRFDRLFLDEENKRFGFRVADKHQFLDTAALFKGWRLGMLGLLEEMSFYDFASTVLETRAYGVYFNLPYCCEMLEVDVGDLGDAHRASVDVVMTHRVMEQLRGILVDTKKGDEENGNE